MALTSCHSTEERFEGEQNKGGTEEIYKKVGNINKFCHYAVASKEDDDEHFETPKPNKRKGPLQSRDGGTHKRTALPRNLLQSRQQRPPRQSQTGIQLACNNARGIITLTKTLREQAERQTQLELNAANQQAEVKQALKPDSMIDVLHEALADKTRVKKVTAVMLKTCATQLTTAIVNQVKAGLGHLSEEDSNSFQTVIKDMQDKTTQQNIDTKLALTKTVALQQQLDATEATVSELTAKLISSEEAAQQVRMQIQVLTKASSDLTSTTKKHFKTHEKAYRKLNDQLEQLRSNYEELQKAVDSLQEDTTTLKAAHMGRDCDGEMVPTQEQMSHMRKTITGLTLEIKALQRAQSDTDETEQPRLTRSRSNIANPVSQTDTPVTTNISVVSKDGKTVSTTAHTIGNSRAAYAGDRPTPKHSKAALTKRMDAKIQPLSKIDLGTSYPEANDDMLNEYVRMEDNIPALNSKAGKHLAWKLKKNPSPPSVEDFLTTLGDEDYPNLPLGVPIPRGNTYDEDQLKKLWLAWHEANDATPPGSRARCVHNMVFKHSPTRCSDKSTKAPGALVIGCRCKSNEEVAPHFYILAKTAMNDMITEDEEDNSD